MLDIETWKNIDNKIKIKMFENGLTPEMIKSPVVGELNELAIKIDSKQWETLFYGNGEAFISVNIDGTDYEFVYVVDTYGVNSYIVNF